VSLKPVTMCPKCKFTHDEENSKGEFVPCPEHSGVPRTAVLGELNSDGYREVIFGAANPIVPVERTRAIAKCLPEFWETPNE
jgi:hypothetical protein